jgi:hypothetical protein
MPAVVSKDPVGFGSELAVGDDELPHEVPPSADVLPRSSGQPVAARMTSASIVHDVPRMIDVVALSCSS